MASKHGRKRKTPVDWVRVREHPDELETKKKGGTSASDCDDVLVCKYCAVEIDTASGKKPWDRINEHLRSKRHRNMKTNYEKRMLAGKQLTL